MCVAFLISYFLEVLFEHLKNTFHILDTIEGTPKSNPILIGTKMKPVALPKNVWNETF